MPTKGTATPLFAAKNAGESSKLKYQGFPLHNATLDMGQERCFASADAHGGKEIDPQTTALVMIEFQV